MADERARTNRVEFRLPSPDLLDKLDKLAAAEGTTRNAKALEILTAALQDKFHGRVIEDIGLLHERVESVGRNLANLATTILTHIILEKGASQAKYEEVEGQAAKLVELVITEP